MKLCYLTALVWGLFLLQPFCPAMTLNGEPYIHDPSTVVQCDGKYYTFGTGGGGLISNDGWTWRSGAVRPGGGAAPDVMKIGDRYLVVYGATGGGLGGGHNGRILTMWNKTLDPNSPDFKYTEPIEVASSDGIEDCDAIDPSLCLDPKGRLWCTYGTYFGYIRIVQLDPKTGMRVKGNKPVNIAIDCEATALIYRDGWYYLFGTHGTCCSGTHSTYNIRVGRSRKPTGPYLDNMGIDMLRGGGKLVVAANNRLIGPGHFGLIDLGNDVQKFSCHYEADMDRGGRSVLDIRPLLWKNGWPVAGDMFTGGTFAIESERSGYCLELAVEAVPLSENRRIRQMSSGPRGPGGGAGPGGPGGPSGPGMGRRYSGPVTPIPDQDVAAVSVNWPAGSVGLRLGDYMLQAHQKWTITPVPNVGGYLGSPFFKITIAGTDRALAATEDAELEVVAAFTGEPEQLWRIDQLIDGTYRIIPMAESDSKEPLALTAVSVSTPSLTKFDPRSDKSRWNLRKP
ncbi:MAG TPA: family 43 glycosylhydrolase [Anaerohalosphaeraceae bacterium]|nr:family 43 glycosylhydrolase [Anaerohalosphaeraceae bacterium]HOL32586.1 family 43 glycosylhydrolase [Anaerohalosphaeraceae bacterium]HOM77300.1 family 43 glycosylhydrolase [Anaerohalosphaeraceae bacterium]HPB94095.1 family 43 glycosylhydrolase [Anaerohalosphaeraceae bacterium]HPO70774.1 family 43 glycosylhydrolase [Anaerohalosphaeraceae bacterium]